MSEYPIVVVHPAAEDVARQLGLAPRLPSLRGARLGLIDNSKHNADAFLHTLETILTRDYGVACVERYRKASPAFPPRPRSWPAWPHPAMPWCTASPTEGRA
jgi:hypothetical protein